MLFKAKPASHKETLENLLRTIGVNAQWVPVPNSPDTYNALISYSNISLTIYLERNMLIVTGGFGYVPKGNLTPLYRKMLTVNFSLVGANFSINETDNSIQLRTARFMEGLESIQFKALMDNLTATAYSHAFPLVNQFQIPQTL